MTRKSIKLEWVSGRRGEQISFFEDHVFTVRFSPKVSDGIYLPPFLLTVHEENNSLTTVVELDRAKSIHFLHQMAEGIADDLTKMAGEEPPSSSLIVTPAITAANATEIMCRLLWEVDCVEKFFINNRTPDLRFSRIDEYLSSAARNLNLAIEAYSGKGVTGGKE